MVSDNQQEEPSPTFGILRAQLQHRAQKTKWLSIGLAAFIAVVTSGDVADSIYASSCRWLRSLTITGMVGAGFCAAHSYLRCDSKDAQIAARIRDGEIKEGYRSQPGDWPRQIDKYTVGAVAFLVISVGSFLAAAWIAAF